MQKVNTVLKHLIIYAIGLIMLLPFLWMISSSFKSPGEILAVPIKWIPTEIYYENYINAVTGFPFVGFFLNSVITTIGVIIGQLITSVLAAYAFAKMEFKGKNILFIGLLSALMLPAQTIMIPMVRILSSLGLTNSLLGLIIPFSWSALIIFLLRQFFLKIPNEIEEAATIDGASLMQTIIHIIIPMSKPILATSTILIFIYGWNQYFWPLLLTNEEQYYTLQLGLSYFKDQNAINTDWGALMAATTLVMLPVIIVFLIFQRKVIESIAFSGGKE